GSGGAPSSRTVTAICRAGVRCDIATAGGHAIVTDEPESRGGRNEGASPLAHLTAALASCHMVQTVKVAEAMRFNHGEIRIRCSTTTVRPPSPATGEPVLRFSVAELVVDLPTDEPPERVERLRKLSEDKCPVGNLFKDAGARLDVIWNIVPLKA